MTGRAKRLVLVQLMSLVIVSFASFSMSAEKTEESKNDFLWIKVPQSVVDEYTPSQILSQERTLREEGQFMIRDPETPVAAQQVQRVLKLKGLEGPVPPDLPGFKKPTIHVVALGFATDKTIGKGVQANGLNLRDRIQEAFEPIFGVSVKFYWIGWEKHLSVENIEKTVIELSKVVQSQDSVLVYVATHGAYDPSRPVGDEEAQFANRLWHFFQLEGKEGGPREYIWRFDLRDKIYNGFKTKPALFTILSDSCFNSAYSERAATRRAQKSLLPAGATLASLLLDQSGEVDITASSRGQYAWYINNNDYTEDGGGLFTSVFCALAKERQEFPTTWNSFFSELRANTDQACQRIKPGVSQLPQLIIPLSKVEFNSRLELKP